MSAADQVRDRANMLLAGPRGRRLLLEYALQSELSKNPVRGTDTFGHAAVMASSSFPGTRGGGNSGHFGERRQHPRLTPSEVAERLSGLHLSEPTPELVRDALASAVDHARYWEAPDGEDTLAATPVMKSALLRVAQLVAASPSSAWWRTPLDAQAQRSVQWDGAEPKPRLSNEDTAHLLTEEDGGWWSCPPRNVPVSARALFDGSPAGLWFIEDNLGWENAESVSLLVPNDVRVFEIASADDWAQLCVTFPRDVTVQVRDEWHRATTRAGRWSVPDWTQVAQNYEAVHLQVGAYLSLAGRPIPIDDASESASMIAGWSPDETYWFTSRIAYGEERASWVLREHGNGTVWLPDPSPL